MHSCGICKADVADEHCQGIQCWPNLAAQKRTQVSDGCCLKRGAWAEPVGHQKKALRALRSSADGAAPSAPGSDLSNAGPPLGTSASVPAADVDATLDDIGSARSSGSAGSSPRSPSATSEIKSIGPYRLLQLLGEGGMGEVWLAEQKKPIQRTVALKLIKTGMDTKAVVARFESERQALALMDHPNIARVFDAGSTPEGRPYFVMEYVPGLPLTEYCDKHRLSMKERLALFLQVCDGVQHAHQKAVIHRDLKPSKVLVVEHESNAVPKIIDFGLAKAIGQRLIEKTLFTELGVMMGTPEYMSPEQADQREQNIDTRTDVYSLGVILYQLLVGVLPFDAKTFRAVGLEAILRVIREQEPPKPSAMHSKRQNVRVPLSDGVGPTADTAQCS